MTHPGKARLMDPEGKVPAFLPCLLGKCEIEPLGSSMKVFEPFGASIRRVEIITCFVSNHSAL